MDPLSPSPDKDVQSMTTAVSVRSEPDAVPLKALQAEAVLWFLAAVLGQWMFIVHIAPWRPM